MMYPCQLATRSCSGIVILDSLGGTCLMFSRDVRKKREYTMKRILIYSHDTFGLGNIRRMLSIAKHLVAGRSDYSILLLSGSPMLHAFRIPQYIDYVKLPCLQRDSEGQYRVRTLALSMENTVNLRSNIILSTVLDYQPDIMLVDKKPLGLCGELKAALEQLKRRSNAPRILLLLRDILDSPEATRSVWKKRGYFNAIHHYYDQILTVGQEDFFNLGKEYAFPPEAMGKLKYCGYIRREPGLTSRKNLRVQLGLRDQHKLVLVTAGGGKDGVQLILNYLKGFQANADENVHSLVLCGPEMSEKDARNIRKRAKNCLRLTLRSFTDDLMSYLDAADVVVSMFGYNTSCEILTLKKPAVVVPRVRPVQEQWIRAERMARLGLVKVIHPDLMNPENLFLAVNSLLSQSCDPPLSKNRIMLDALPVISRVIAEELHRKDVQEIEMPQVMEPFSGVVTPLTDHPVELPSLKDSHSSVARSLLFAEAAE